jgi:hypothetical protein
MTDQTTTAIGAIEARFQSLLQEIEAVPGGVTHALQSAKTKLLEAWTHVEAHFESAKTTAEADVSQVAGDAAKEATVVQDATAQPQAPAAAAPSADASSASTAATDPDPNAAPAAAEASAAQAQPNPAAAAPAADPTASAAAAAPAAQASVDASSSTTTGAGS